MIFSCSCTIPSSWKDFDLGNIAEYGERWRGGERDRKPSTWRRIRQRIERCFYLKFVYRVHRMHWCVFLWRTGYIAPSISSVRFTDLQNVPAVARIPRSKIFFKLDTDEFFSLLEKVAFRCPFSIVRLYLIKCYEYILLLVILLSRKDRSFLYFCFISFFLSFQTREKYSRIVSTYFF